jgi:predicted transcriptional regulator
MDQKGLVSHKTQGRTFIYTPRYSRQQAASRFLEHVFDGALDQAVLSMISTANPAPEELRQIAKIVADARRRKQGEEPQKGEP